MSNITLPEIESKQDYVDFINRRASEIVTNALHGELDYEDYEQLDEYIEKKESFQTAMISMSEEWNNYNVSDIAQVYEIISNNYHMTIVQVEKNPEWFEDDHPLDSFREYVKACVAYDVSKMVDKKIDDTMDDDKSVDVVEV